MPGVIDSGRYPVMAMVSDQKPGRRSRRKAASDCRKGDHRYGSPKHVGGGVTRQTCSVCRAVTIDLTRTERMVEPALFGSSGARSARR